MTKNVFKGIGVGAAGVASIAVMIVTGGRFKK
jgi:hypothetical protein